MDKLNLIKGKLNNMQNNHYSLTVRLQVTQNELKLMKREFKEKPVLIGIVRKATKAKKCGGKRQERGPGEVKNRQRYEFCV